MTYTEEDILDLYTDLQDIGLAETPAEEAQRHHTDFINLMRGKSIIQTRPIECYFRDYLLQNQIPHSYASIFNVIQDSCYMFIIYFVIRGQNFRFRGMSLGPLDPIPQHIVFHQDHSSLLEHAEILKARWPNLQGNTLNIK